MAGHCEAELKLDRAQVPASLTQKVSPFVDKWARDGFLHASTDEFY
jgi:hypothetical protein